MTNKEVVKGFFIECYQKHNYDYGMKYISETYIDHSPYHAKTNKEAVDLLKYLENFYKDVTIKILDMIEEDNKVSVRVNFSMIQIGEVMAIKPTFKRFNFDAIEIFRLDKGIIVES